MSTYGELQQQIAFEMGNRLDLLTAPADFPLLVSPVKRAITTAIARYERLQFWFNQLRSSAGFTTVPGQEFYDSSDWASLATDPIILSLTVVNAGTRYMLNSRQWKYLEDLSLNPGWRGLPLDWAYFGQQLRLYPIPDQAYPVNVMAVQRLPALVDDSDTNAWTTDAEALIRCEAKADLWANVTLAQPDPVLAGTCSVEAQQYLRDLQAETSRRSGGNRVRPTVF